MSRIAIPDITSATGATADIYARVKKISGGRVPNTDAALAYLARPADRICRFFLLGES